MIEVSPAKRSRIIREVHADPDRKWRGSVGGRRAELQIEFVRERVGLGYGPGGETMVRWRVCVARRWYEGLAGTVWDALIAMSGSFSRGREVCELTAPLFEGIEQ